MTPYARLLVATDLSARARPALERAARLARQHRARLTLLHVLDPRLPERRLAHLIAGAGEPLPFPDPEAAETALRNEVAAVTGHLGPAPETRVATGKDFVEIIHVARELDVDLVVLGAHGENFLRDWVLGTTAERVARKGDRSVLVVKQPAAADYRRVLVAVDYSSPSRLALAEARRLAPAAEVHLLHVFDPWPLEIMERSRTDPERIAATRYALLNEASDRLRDFVAEFEAAVQPDRTGVLDDPHAGNAINRHAEAMGADLIVVGSHGQTSLRSILLGSVAEHVLRESACDVCAVRAGAPDFEPP